MINQTLDEACIELQNLIKPNAKFSLTPEFVAGVQEIAHELANKIVARAGAFATNRTSKTKSSVKEEDLVAAWKTIQHDLHK